MYDLHAYAKARQIETEYALKRSFHASQLPTETRSRGKLIRLFRGESPQAQAA